MKLKELTRDQQQKLAEFRAEMFAQATSTEPADRARAETAARRMAGIGGVNINRVVWVSTPEQGLVVYNEAWNSLRDSISDSLSDSLRASLRDSISDSLRYSLRDSISDSLWASLSGSLWASLSDSLWDSISDSLRDSISDSLWDSLSDSLWDSPWLAFYSFPMLHMGFEYAPDDAEKLNLHREIAASCFAVWIVLGTVILCDRPETVEVVDGKLVSLTWRKEVCG